MSPISHALMWSPHVRTASGEWDAEMAFGWFRGTHRGHTLLSHSGAETSGQAESAVGHRRRAVELDPDHQGARSALRRLSGGGSD